MKTYTIDLTRTYRVVVKANTAKRARECAEFFLGDCPDCSTEQDRKRYNFSIKEIEMVWNDGVRSCCD